VTSAPPAPVGPATVSVPPADVTLPGGTHASVGVNLTPSDRSRPVDPSVATRAIRETLIWEHATPASDRAELRMLLRAAVLTSYAGGVSDMRITRLDLTP